MNKYILGAALSLGILLSPALSSAASLTSDQINSIIMLLNSFGADSATIANVQASLTGGTPTISSRAFCYTFNHNLTVGSSGSDVKALNTALSSAGINTTGNTSLFNENVAGDVVSFQAKYGIRQTGFVGPATRTKLNALYGCHAQPQSTSALQSIPQQTQSTPQSTPEPTQPTTTTVEEQTTSVVPTATIDQSSLTSISETPTTTGAVSVASVDLKVNGSDGPVTFGDNDPITVTLATKNITSCRINNVRMSSDGEPASSTLIPLTGDVSTYNFYAWVPDPQVTISVQCNASDGSTKSDSVIVNDDSVGFFQGSRNSSVASAISAFEGAGPRSAYPQASATFSYVWNTDLQIGSPYWSDVTALQTALAHDGEYVGDSTGGFYNDTYAAVLAFQEKYGINTTGYVGPATRAKLNSLFGK